MTSIIGGILELRRSWVIYESIHRKLANRLQAYNQSDPNMKYKNEDSDDLYQNLPLENVKSLLASVSYGKFFLKNFLYKIYLKYICVFSA